MSRGPTQLKYQVRDADDLPQFDKRVFAIQPLLFGLVFAWWGITGVYLVAQLLATKGDILEYLTYWSLLFEWVLLTLILSLHAASGRKHMRDSNVAWRIPVIFVGWYLAISTLVLVGSVYISASGFIAVGDYIRIDPAAGVGNFVIHTVPWIVAILLAVVYEREIVDHLARAKLVLFFLPSASDAESLLPESVVKIKDDIDKDKFAKYLVRYSVVRAIMDLAFFLVPVIPPVAWFMVSSTSDTYKLPCPPFAFYVLLSCSLIAPLVFLSSFAKIRWGRRRWLA